MGVGETNESTLWWQKGKTHQLPHFIGEETESQELDLPYTHAVSLGQMQDYKL